MRIRLLEDAARWVRRYASRMRKNPIPLCLALLVPSAPWTASAADAGAAPAPQRYAIKQTAPDTGTHIVREVVSSTLPLDKPYGDLTPEQQRIVKSQYEQMGPDDEPPYPLNGPRGIYRKVANGQGKRQAKGLLSLVADVDIRGEATSVSVLASPDPELTQYVAGVLMDAKYKPARCNGAPCAMQYPVRFNLIPAD
ncbi:hypothetical protein [Rhizobacter sp. P5_C2]